MTPEFAIDFIPRRMRELGYGTDYIVRWRQFILDVSSILEIDAQNEYYYLINPSNTIEVSSKFGIYSLNDAGINEPLYEHRGKIKVKNLVNGRLLVLFIQVIPKHEADRK